MRVAIAALAAIVVVIASAPARAETVDVTGTLGTVAVAGVRGYAALDVRVRVTDDDTGFARIGAVFGDFPKDEGIGRPNAVGSPRLGWRHRFRLDPCFALTAALSVTPGIAGAGAANFDRLLDFHDDFATLPDLAPSISLGYRDGAIAAELAAGVYVVVDRAFTGERRLELAMPYGLATGAYRLSDSIALTARLGLGIEAPSLRESSNPSVIGAGVEIASHFDVQLRTTFGGDAVALTVDARLPL